MLTLYLQRVFKFLCANIPFKNEKKVVGYRLGTYRYFREALERDWERRSKPM